MYCFWIFLRVKWNKTETVMTKLKELTGSVRFLSWASSISVILGLIWAGTTYPWASAQVLAPITIGLLGLVAFYSTKVYRRSKNLSYHYASSTADGDYPLYQHIYQQRATFLGFLLPSGLLSGCTGLIRLGLPSLCCLYRSRLYLLRFVAPY